MISIYLIDNVLLIKSLLDNLLQTSVDILADMLLEPDSSFLSLVVVVVHEFDDAMVFAESKFYVDDAELLAHL